MVESSGGNRRRRLGVLWSKDQGWSIGIGTLASILAALGTVWSVGIPIAQAQISNEIRKQTQPLNDAFYVILVQNIENQKDAITAMEFKREMCGNDTTTCWTLRDARDLQRARDTLTSMLQAKDRLERR
jgi:hypothetical protein